MNHDIPALHYNYKIIPIALPLHSYRISLYKWCSFGLFSTELFDRLQNSQPTPPPIQNDETGKDYKKDNFKQILTLILYDFLSIISLSSLAWSPSPWLVKPSRMQRLPSPTQQLTPTRQLIPTRDWLMLQLLSPWPTRSTAPPWPTRPTIGHMLTVPCHIPTDTTLPLIWSKSNDEIDLEIKSGVECERSDGQWIKKAKPKIFQLYAFNSRKSSDSIIIIWR